MHCNSFFPDNNNNNKYEDNSSAPHHGSFSPPTLTASSPNSDLDDMVISSPTLNNNNDNSYNNNNNDIMATSLNGIQNGVLYYNGNFTNTTNDLMYNNPYCGGDSQRQQQQQQQQRRDGISPIMASMMITDSSMLHASTSTITNSPQHSPQLDHTLPPSPPNGYASHAQVPTDQHLLLMQQQQQLQQLQQQQQQQQHLYQQQQQLKQHYSPQHASPAVVGDDIIAQAIVLFHELKHSEQRQSDELETLRRENEALKSKINTANKVQLHIHYMLQPQATQQAIQLHNKAISEQEQEELNRKRQQAESAQRARYHQLLRMMYEQQQQQMNLVQQQQQQQEQEQLRQQHQEQLQQQQLQLLQDEQQDPFLRTTSDGWNRHSALFKLDNSQYTLAEYSFESRDVNPAALADSSIWNPEYFHSVDQWHKFCARVGLSRKNNILKTNVAVAIINHLPFFSSWNEAFKKIWGFTEEQLQNKVPYYDILAIPNRIKSARTVLSVITGQYNIMDLIYEYVPKTSPQKEHEVVPGRLYRMRARKVGVDTRGNVFEFVNEVHFIMDPKDPRNILSMVFVNHV